MKSVNEMAAEGINSVPQYQGSLEDQLSILTIAANKLGLYDAADWLNSQRAKRKQAIELLAEVPKATKRKKS